MDKEGRATQFHYWAMGIAVAVSKRSRDPSTKVGAVIIRPDKTVVSVGYNGFPRGVQDHQFRYEDRKTKYAMVCHAEANAVVTAKESLEGCTLYATMCPCQECAKLIIQSGIKSVFCPVPTPELIERWGESYSFANLMFTEADVKVLVLPGDIEGIDSAREITRIT
jgi:dCMP deaminase